MDFDSLSGEEKADFHLLNNHIERRHYFLQRDKKQFQAIEHWLPDTRAIMAFINDRRAGKKPDGQQVAALMNQWIEQTETLQGELEVSPPLLKKMPMRPNRALEDVREVLDVIGGIQIYSLYRDLVSSGEMSAVDFHDTILKRKHSNTDGKGTFNRMNPCSETR